MKTLTISKADFDEILYPLIALDPVSDRSALRICLNVLGKLEAKAKLGPETNGTPRLWVLKEETTDLELEDAEAEFVVARLEAGIPRLAATRARAIEPMLTALAG